MKKHLSTADRIGRNLRDSAAANGLTQREVARRSGLHFVSVNRIFKGVHTPCLETLESLAKACGVPLEKIFANPS